jgi:hypothetical protein
MNPPRTMLILLLVLGTLQVAVADDKTGRSKHGSAFDTGLRQKPWRMEGIGKALFRITTEVPAVREWFDQGNAVLQSFWYEEAERAFRWCLIGSTSSTICGALSIWRHS